MSRSSARCGATISSTRWLSEIVSRKADRSWPMEVSLVRMRAAALDLLAQEPQVLGDRPFLGQGMVELLRHEGDGGERRAEFVGGRGREAVELGEVLLAGQHQLGRGERLGELARLLGDPPRVDARERRAEQDRGPDPGHVDERQARGSRPGYQGRGRWAQDQDRRRARPPAARARASAPGVSAVAEIRTGARNSIENGFCSPPVR